ncbi:AAA family ATPase [Wohlfahrtiimonas chitiniclastica]|uniref:AAA family ATPase n=1 Tax=Wohlfahrtiimonas chitiniclastica TaxID=400946 RepID=UPI00164C698A|nr:AAA family ATPase [Wohlfahrtiimonas chitiniclastica]
MKSFFAKDSFLNSNMKIEMYSESPIIRFSNTGRRGDVKYFDISLVSFISVLKDILKNIDKFERHSSYVEGTWRDLFSKHISDPAIHALSTVQTLPLFVVINKAICAANDIQTYDDKVMPLTADNVEQTITVLKARYGLGYVDIDNIGKNIIYYGAPGTGKSHSIDLLTKSSSLNMVRTVFHADTSRSDFIGTLKPTMNNAGSIEYSFAPGPLTQILVNALKDPTKHYYLVIEEINRAPAASVFGEIFQLLDRDDRGKSKYSITITDRDWKKYLESELVDFSGELFIPSNLSILATMNSSDQAVMPLDTAFKRRWIFKYQHINFSAAPNGDIYIYNEKPIKWADFAQAINSILSQNSIPEDRLLGPWFVTENEIHQDAARETLKGKVLSYLWDDVLRHRGRDIIFSSDIKTFAQLCQHIDNNEEVFSKVLIDELLSDVEN